MYEKLPRIITMVILQERFEAENMEAGYEFPSPISKVKLMLTKHKLRKILGLTLDLQTYLVLSILNVDSPLMG
jgi:hypothetical protein